MATRYLEGDGIFLSPVEETDVSVLLEMQNEKFIPKDTEGQVFYPNGLSMMVTIMIATSMIVFLGSESLRMNNKPKKG